MTLTKNKMEQRLVIEKIPEDENTDFTFIFLVISNFSI
jgi:hypothetical protein